MRELKWLKHGIEMNTVIVETCLPKSYGIAET